MIGKTWLLAFVAAGLVAAAPAAAQANSPNPFELPRAQRFEHGHPGRHHAWRTERRGDRLEHRGQRWDRRSGRLRHGGRQERRHRWHDGSI
jgi:Ni/Co efflux regulator RcnB